MAVTKATYTATAPWTASALADLFEDAFVASGLMTAWYDSFLSGSIENRILEVAYDATKAYGTTYYWFMFTTSGVYIHVATGWNSTTHVPTGTQYVDYYSTTTNSTTNHNLVRSLSSSTTVSVTRYTSGVDTNFSWYLIQNGTANQEFYIPVASANIAGWVNLDKVVFHPVVTAVAVTNSRRGNLEFRNLSPAIGRSYLAQGALEGATFNGYYKDYFPHSTHSYAGLGNTITANATTSVPTTFITLPIGFASANSAYAADSTPVCSSPAFWAYLSDSAPADFGIAIQYANNTMAVQDTLVVSAGVEEWEILSVTNNATVNDGASPMFLARTV